MTKVFANNSAVVCAAGSGKVVAAFPDVCMSPPGPPAGPVPVPYADTSHARDTKSGSKRVKIGGKPVFLAGKSHLASKPLGDDAATKSFGGSLINATTVGKAQFGAHSMDVKVEGEFVCRHLDLATSNHASYPGATPPFPEMEEMNLVALQRMQDEVCPCCGSGECPAKFMPGDEAQSLEDFYGLNETGGDGQPTAEALLRRKTYKRLLALKEDGYCTCDGQVFPRAPCDVFRAHDPVRTRGISNKWTAATEKFRTNYLVAHPDAIASFHARNPDELRVLDRATFSKVDHLTPRGAGGCPDNPGNLQPHDLLCATCKMIDDTFGAWQGNNPNWLRAWNEVFRKTGIKRRRLDAFTPGWW